MIAKETVADMLNVDEYITQTGFNTPYLGMCIFVANDPDPINNGFYILNDLDNISCIDSWKKIHTETSVLNDVERLKYLLRNAIDILCKNNYVFEIVNDIGISREEFNVLYNKGDEK